MNAIPQGKDMKGTYENFIARCPWCGQENIFNRASDLNGFAPISHREVSCLFSDCSKPFSLSGDSINSAYEMIIFDCYELLQRKHYAYCILNLAQAFEVFFSQYLRVELLYKPFAVESDKDIDFLNELMGLLYRKTERLSFDLMKNLFLSRVLDVGQPKSLREAESIMNQFPDKPSCPSDEAISTAGVSIGVRITELLLRLKSCKVPQKRNQVVHKRAYRPTLAEVNDSLKETREILFPLARALDVHIDEVNWYMRQTG